MSNVSPTSYIEDHEEEEVKRLVLERYKKFDEKFKLPTPVGHRIVVALNVRPDQMELYKDEATGKSVMLVLPDTITKEDKYKSCTGCVIGIGPDAYADKEYYPTGPYCKVGDFISFPRHAGAQYNYMGIPVHNIPANAPYETLESPDHVYLY